MAGWSRARLVSAQWRTALRGSPPVGPVLRLRSCMLVLGGWLILGSAHRSCADFGSMGPVGAKDGIEVRDVMLNRIGAPGFLAARSGLVDLAGFWQRSIGGRSGTAESHPFAIRTGSPSPYRSNEATLDVRSHRSWLEPGIRARPPALIWTLSLLATDRSDFFRSLVHCSCVVSLKSATSKRTRRLRCSR